MIGMRLCGCDLEYERYVYSKLKKYKISLTVKHHFLDIIITDIVDNLI